jgi:hypothetical protein
MKKNTFFSINIHFNKKKNKNLTFNSEIKNSSSIIQYHLKIVRNKKNEKKKKKKKEPNLLNYFF